MPYFLTTHYYLLLTEMRTINEIIVHCAATREGADYDVKNIDYWHKSKGWAGCGYHYVIKLDGTIQQGRQESVVGAHCATKIQGTNITHNTHSIGVCYIGGCAADGVTPKDTRTDAQKAALITLLKQLRKKYPDAKIYGHRDFSSKPCPCFDAKSEYASL